MTINSRAKGASAEREFSNEVYQWAGVKLIRNLEQSRSGGHDLIVHPDEVGAVSDNFRALAIECKRYGKVTPGLIATWWKQARQQAEPHRLHPVLAYRADRTEWRVVTPISLINPDLTQCLELDSTATMALPAFCAVVREGYHVKRNA
ncbi:MAG: hypothetical protein Q8Q50_09245 [Methylobacter sp.]|nr:hypothetical protein [Methylobacter sp.]